MSTNPPTQRILIGDVRERLADLPAASVHCCVTSPPYFGLRDYSTARWDGGTADCDHKVRTDPKIASSTLGGGKKTTGHQAEGFKARCPRCGAVRVDKQIGLEPTLAEYIATMVDVFRGVRRVLRDDGTLFLNIGDSYAANRTYQVTDNKHRDVGNTRGSSVPEGMKPKDLMMVPARLAIALCDDGWYLRSDIIWHKKAPMPESVTDRPTSAHEHIFLLTKSPRYFYDADAVREPSDANEASQRRARYGRYDADDGEAKRNQRTGKPDFLQVPGNHQGESGRNQRNVWTLGPEPFPEAHFATFPTEIPRRCIKAGCPEGGTVLDPFLGSGTTLLVADELGRNGVGIELSPAYAEMARQRVYGASPMFASVEVA